MTRGEVVRLVNSAARLLANVVCDFQILTVILSRFILTKSNLISILAFSIVIDIRLQKAANLKLKHRSALEEAEHKAEKAEKRKKRREAAAREREEENERPEDETPETAVSTHGRGAPRAFLSLTAR